MKVLFAPLGTYGDIAPLISYAKELRSKGHFVSFAITADYKEYIQENNFPCTIIPFDFGEYAKRNISCIGKPLRSLFHFKKEVCSLTELCYQTLKDKVSDIDLIIGSGLQFSAFNLAEAANIPYKHILHAPVWIPSKHTLPPYLASNSTILL